MNSTPVPSRYRRNMFLNLAAGVAAGVAALALTACGADDTPTADAAPAPVSTTTSPTTIARPSTEVDELVATGNGRLHVRCHGSGDSTVLLPSGFEGDGNGWGEVEPALAERTRVCAYDRFGTGTSDAPATTQSFGTQADDLHAALTKLGEPGPYVVVGHSFGGAEAVEFTSRNASEVAGLVLLDASPTTWRDVVCEVPAYAPLCTQLSDPNMNKEHLDADAAFAEVSTIESLGSLPMTVITADQRQTTGLPAPDVARLNDAWNEGQQAWVALSTAAKVVTLDNTSHYIQLDRPADVVREIRDLLPAPRSQATSRR
jgi:pimeloyl-ACP methyl ester carboxylesterase